MDVTDADNHRLGTAVELFLEGHSIACDGVVLENDRRNGTLRVNSYSDWDLERSTPDHAREKIARAKRVLAELMERNSTLGDYAGRRPMEHVFCHDHGLGAVALAREVDGRFEWLGP